MISDVKIANRNNRKLTDEMIAYDYSVENER